MAAYVTLRLPDLATAGKFLQEMEDPTGFLAVGDLAGGLLWQCAPADAEVIEVADTFPAND